MRHFPVTESLLTLANKGLYFLLLSSSGPHVSATHPWPMSQVSGIFGTDDDEEIKDRLALILENTSGLGLIHESVNVYNTSDFTRPWFAWANSYFAEMMLDLAERKPGLIFKDKTPYVVGKSGN